MKSNSAVEGIVSWRAIVAVMAASFTCVSAHAQTVPADESAATQSGGVEEIIVTAQKRSERLTDVPMSITAASGEQLSRQGITAPADLERIVPGFTFQQSNYGTPVFTIRGVGC